MQRRTWIIVIVCVGAGTLLIGGVTVLLVWLAAVGDAMSGDAECIPQELPDGATFTNPRCVHGRVIPLPPSAVDASAHER